MRHTEMEAIVVIFKSPQYLNVLNHEIKRKETCDNKFSILLSHKGFA